MSRPRLTERSSEHLIILCRYFRNFAGQDRQKTLIMPMEDECICFVMFVCTIPRQRCC